MSTFSGSLHGKRRADLVEIAEALKLATDGNIGDLKERITQHLDQNESELSGDARFKGLYGARRNRQHNESDSETPSAETKAAVRAARKSVGRAVDRVQSVVDAAGIPLPDSPIVKKVADVANSALEAATDASQALVTNASSASQALVPTKKAQRELERYWRGIASQVMKYTDQGQQRVDRLAEPVREALSTPQNLIAAFLIIELSHLVWTSSQAYNHTIFFPPAGGTAGSLDSLVGSLFSWAPKVQFTVTVPEWANWNPRSQVWASSAWWLLSTVVPALAGSSVLSLTHHAKHKGPTTRSQSQQPHPTFDPFIFAVLRFFLLLWPLTSSAPTSLVDSLEMCGNSQGRALAAGLMLALVAAQRFSN